MKKKEKVGADDFLKKHGVNAKNVNGARRDPFDPGSSPKSCLLLRQVAALLEPIRAGSDPVVVADQLRRVVALLAHADRLTVSLAKGLTIAAVKAAKLPRPAQLVDAAFVELESASDEEETALAIIDTEPSEESGDDVLGEIVGTIERYIILPPGAAVLISFWISLTYLTASPALDILPLLSIVSPVRRCGKTTLLALLAALAQRGLPTANITAAALFRTVEKYKPTLLVDEADTFLRTSEELRGILNAGHTRATAFAIRTVGDEHEPRVFSTWSSKAIAMIGAPPPTIEDRSITIRLKRKVKTEKVARLRLGRVHDDLAVVRRRLARWALDRGPAFADADPPLPEGLNDRAQDNVRPLLQIAQAAGGPWLARAYEAVRLVYGGAASEMSEDGVALLQDIRDLLADAATCTLIARYGLKGEPVAVIPAALHRELLLLEERPWKSWDKGYPISLHKVGRMLADFGVESRTVRIGDQASRSYRISDLEECFERYLPVDGPSDPAQAAQVNDAEGLGADHISGTNDSVPDMESAASPRETRDVPDVPDSKPVEGAKKDRESF